LFAFPRVMGLFLRSEAPGLVFSVTYPWGSFAPSAFSAYGGRYSKILHLMTSQMKVVPRVSYGNHKARVWKEAIAEEIYDSFGLLELNI